MDNVVEGMYWHCHHDVLLEWVWDYIGRVNGICFLKPANEIDLRLRLFKPVIGQLPSAVAEAAANYAAAWKRYAQACKCESSMYDFKAASDAWYAASLALAEVLINYKQEIEELHKQECPDCPWDGRTIFPEVSNAQSNAALS
jgi:hypothetical protein